MRIVLLNESEPGPSAGRGAFLMEGYCKPEQVNLGSSSHGRQHNHLQLLQKKQTCQSIKQMNTKSMDYGPSWSSKIKKKEAPWGCGEGHQPTKLTFVVRTPQFSSFSKEGGVALGVSRNSNSLSLPLRLVDLDILAESTVPKKPIGNFPD